MKLKQQALDLQCASLAEPFAFRERIRKPDTRVDFIPVLDMIVIAMLLSLLFTRFVAMPGVRVDLPITEMRIQHSQQSVAVLTIGNNGMLFFDGAVFEPATIQRGFSSYITRVSSMSPVLLVKAEFKMEMQDFLHLCEMAKGAGFVQIQLAGKQKEVEAELLPAPVQE
jgi:biopolymer transport protein ExbD